MEILDKKPNPSQVEPVTVKIESHEKSDPTELLASSRSESYSHISAATSISAA